MRTFFVTLLHILDLQQSWVEAMICNKCPGLLLPHRGLRYASFLLTAFPRLSPGYWSHEGSSIHLVAGMLWRYPALDCVLPGCMQIQALKFLLAEEDWFPGQICNFTWSPEAQSKAWFLIPEEWVRENQSRNICLDMFKFCWSSLHHGV